MAGALVVALAVAGCGSDDERTRTTAGPTETTKPGGESPSTSGAGGAGGASIVLAVPADPDSVDPHKTLISEGRQFTSFLYDSLLDVTATGEIVPRLASSWEQSPDEVTVTLRDDILCNDGTTLTPTAVKASFDRLKQPDTASNAELMFGTADYEVTADDAAMTVTFTFPEPFSSALLGLANPAGAVICPSGLADVDQLSDPQLLAKSGGWGTGPYQLVKAVTGDSYTFVPRPEYAWGIDSATMDRPDAPREVILKVIANESTAVSQLLGGEINIALALGPDLARLRDSDLFTIEYASQSHFLIFNEAPGRPMADVEARQAVIQLLDLEEFALATTDNLGEVATSFSLPDVLCAADRTIPEQDEAGATAVLRSKGLTVKVAGLVGLQGAGPDYLIAKLTDAGVTVDAAVTDVGTWLDTLLGGGGDWDISLFSMASYPSPRNRFVYMTGSSIADGGNNVGQVHNATAEKLFKESDAAIGDEFCRLMGEGEQALIDNWDQVPVANQLGVYGGNGVTFDYGGVSKLVEPASIRVVG